MVALPWASLESSYSYFVNAPVLMGSNLPKTRIELLSPLFSHLAWGIDDCEAVRFLEKNRLFSTRRLYAGRPRNEMARAVT